MDNITVCPPSCDNWLCWNKTAAGTNVYADCPKDKGILEFGKAYRYCTINGTWETKTDEVGNTINYTHYESCILPEVQAVTDMCLSFGPTECEKIGRKTRTIEIVGLSLSFICLLISLYIFFSYSILKNNRTKIHKNLFLATLFQVTFRLIKYIDYELDSKHFLLDKYHLSEACTVLMEYGKTAMFTWMFIEGLYLHNVVTFTVFQEYLHINFYIWAGWIFSVVMTLIWLTVMIAMRVSTTWTFYYFLPYYWILEGPRSFLIFVNLIFLLNIIRVLVVKLRQSRSSEIEQVRKAIRATIFLLPLMGTAHILFLLDYHYSEAWKFALWSYTSYFLNTFQGFFVAVLYCFLNGEVQKAIISCYFTRMSLRNNNYSRCRQLTLTSTTGVVDCERNTLTDRQSWIGVCCNQPPQSPEENELDLCSIGDKGQKPTITADVESDPFLNVPLQSNGIVSQPPGYQQERSLSETSTIKA
ncbi:PDF receptor [Sitophilus oryzae]|uniref:PDF receptor n=1 Tax=Sitophilus oryzae TaxID=7048 RepID=A0A6J2YUN9_SITOR|nr:PDF receptor [Sitophilus oryzae]XP_030767840.1 PDF receptor [Sitophilus oryzae]XP_030767841.1 PDF receptor [Sitophilus oryzae]XP_030767842.1 PDF receptor [Sitophilus oryzae]